LHYIVETTYNILYDKQGWADRKNQSIEVAA